MIDYNAYRRKIYRLKNAENQSEKAAAAMVQLSGEILAQLVQMTNGFNLLEAPALVAALDRYKAILLDTVDHDRKNIQEVADEINQHTTVAYACIKERRNLDAD